MGNIIGYRTNKGELINSYERMRQKFDYHHIREILKGEYPEDVISIIEYDKYPMMDVCPNRKLLLKIIRGSDPRDLDIVQTTDTLKAENVCVDRKKLIVFLENLGHDVDVIVESIREIITMSLNWDQIHELMLFCSLFAYVQRSPKAEDITLLHQYLKLDSQHVLRCCKEIILSASTTELDCAWRQGDGQPLKLELSVLTNCTDNIILVSLKDCTLRHHVQPGSQLLAMTMDGQIVTFLPRLCVVPGHVMYQEGGELISADEDGKIRDALFLEQDEPALFAFSKNYGLMLADRNGKFTATDAQFWGIFPKGPVRWFAGDLQDYGFVTSDGRYAGLSGHENWDNLFFFDLGAGNGMAVNGNREAINSKGACVGENVAAVSCCGNRSILLRMDGSVCIFLGNQKRDVEELKNPAHAVCADSDGFWIAAGEKLLRLEGNDLYQLELTVEECSLDEIHRDNAGTTVFALSCDDTIIHLR